MTKTIKLTDSHLFISSSNAIDEIIRPLQEHFGVTSLVYQKNYSDGSEIRLSNQPAWLQYYYEHMLYQRSGFEKHPQHLQSGCVVWSHLSHHQPVLEAARSFNIDHGMTLIQKTSDDCEFYFIGTTPDKPQMTNLLLNNREFLQRFTYYFKEQAASLLVEADAKRIIIPQKFANVITEEQGIPYTDPDHTINPHKILKLKKVRISADLTLTEREIACAKLLLQGKSGRLIAEALFISPRTVESHIEHLKEKLNCSSKPALIKQLLALNIQLL